MSSALVRRDWNDDAAEVDLGDRIAAIAAERLGMRRVVARTLPRGVQLADAKETLLLFGSGARPRAVAQISGGRAPAMVARGVARARAIRATLAPRQQLAILEPYGEGALVGRSYAIWPWCAPLAGESGSFLERRTLTTPLLDWLGAVTAQTVRPAHADAIETRFATPLVRMATNSVLSLRARLVARGALQRLDAGTFRPLHVAMHGDLHAGNVLVDDGVESFRSHVSWWERVSLIDWCGAQPDGFPLYDLMRLAHSLRISARRLAPALVATCATLACPIEDARWHLAAALADLGANLEEFPPERYAWIADRTLDWLDATIAVATPRS